jgi:hypothetical protein
MWWLVHFITDILWYPLFSCATKNPLLNNRKVRESLHDTVRAILLEKFMAGKSLYETCCGFDMQDLAEYMRLAFSFYNGMFSLHTLLAINSCKKKFKTTLHCKGKQMYKFSKREYRLESSC